MTLKEARVSAGLTQEEVAKALGVKRSAISMWETGKSFPKAKMLPLISVIYRKPIHELIEMNPEVES